MPRLLIVCALFSWTLLGAAAARAEAAILPSQVLVLYNEEWTGDDPLTEPGQDSLEIARHYVAMHTDARTGEKPFLLGLRCKHRMKHLNEPHLKDASSDNSSGVVLEREGKAIAAAGEMRDSRLVEFTLPKNDKGWDFETLQLELKSGDTAIALVEGGKSLHGVRVAVQTAPEWNVRADGRSFSAEPFTARATCQDNSGKQHRWEAKYQDHFDIACSRTGRDGVRDDQNYLQDVEEPVKAFLEDPANARPDGTLPRDHVLFVVVSYGLPKTATATYGIARGITDILSNHGTAVDFGQRLQVMYYDLEEVMGFDSRPHRFEGKDPFTQYCFRAPQAWPLFGEKANPFLHPSVYKKDKGDLNRLPAPLAFSSANRDKFPGQRLFFPMRIDGTTPMEARGLIDRAVYASKYGGPAMGIIEGVSYAKSKERLGSLLSTGGRVMEWLWAKGLRHMHYGGQGKDLVWLNYLQPGEGFWNQVPVFLPGGAGGTVISHNSWNKQEMVKDLERGTTMTAGAARASQGAPHIHNRSWWDDEILYPFFLSGKTMGEALLMNQAQLEWITTFVGDPLYSWPQTAVKDTAPPRFDTDRGVRFTLVTPPKDKKSVALRLDLSGTPEAPETAQMRVKSNSGREARCETFEAAPFALLGPPAEVCGQTWTVETMDPYGNKNKSPLTIDNALCQ